MRSLAASYDPGRYGFDLEPSRNAFQDAKTNLERLTHVVLLPSLEKGRYGCLAIENQLLSPVFESLGPSAHEQIQQIQHLSWRAKSEVQEIIEHYSDPVKYPGLLRLEKAEQVVNTGTKPQFSWSNHGWNIQAWKRSVIVIRYDYADSDLSSAEYRILELYAAPRCLRWMLSFEERDIPREIRDLIYSELIYSIHDPDETPLRIGPDSRGEFRSYREPNCYVQEDLYQQSWLINPEFVGQRIAGEITKVFFAESHFWLTSAEVLPDLLAYDPFNIGFQPFNWIRKLTILEDVSDSRLHDNLMQLCRIKRKDLLQIELCFLTSFFTSPMFGNRQLDKLQLLEDIRWPVYELIHSCSKVRIWYITIRRSRGPCTRSRVQRIPDYCRKRSRSLYVIKAPMIDYFTLTAEEWNQVSSLRTLIGFR